MTEYDIVDELDREIDDEEALYDAIDRLEEDDVVKVVRCNDCKHREIQNGCDSLYCHLLDTAMGKTDFCSYGERRKRE